MKYILEFIQFCNKNSGVLSLVVAIIAVIVSVKAIKAQNKSTLFEKRLSLYCEVESMYGVCKNILRCCKEPYSIGTKKLITAVLFTFNSEEYTLTQKALALQEKELTLPKEETESLTAQRFALADQYVNLYLAKTNLAFEDRMRLLFTDQKAVEYAIELYQLYDNMKLSLILTEISELEELIQEIGVITRNFQAHKVLKRLAQDLPL